jgi:phosphopantothenoylcysteine synthetase/decarboxylase
MDANLTLIVCGAPLAARTTDIAAHLTDAGWATTVVATPAAMQWLDPVALERVAGLAPRSAFRAPNEPKRNPSPSAVVVCPATFNSVNKAAAGIADTYAMAILCEALGAGIPTVVVPMVNDKLWRHPAWDRSLSLLRRCRTALIDVATGCPQADPVDSGTGERITAQFDPAWLTAALPAPR